VQSLLDAANMGKGAWWVSVKIGGMIMTVMAALAYLVDKIRWH
jgi:hypothetical protein